MNSSEYSKNYDVVVAGGGIAGVAAALAAARNGAKVALIEKTVLLGGLTTTGMINVYLPLCDGNGTQVTSGIAEELLKLSMKYGPGDVPADWREVRNAKEEDRYRVLFSPMSLALVLDEVLENVEVDVWLDTLICDVELDADNSPRSVFVENSSGRSAINGKCFIDATGDAGVARKAGVPVEFGDNWLSVWALECQRDGAERWRLTPGINILTAGDGEREFREPDALDVSQCMLEGRKMLREHYAKAYEEGESDRHGLYPLTLPTMPQFRKIAAIQGQVTLKDDMHEETWPDSIGLVADWRKSGFVWEIPFRALLPRNTKRLLVAGRCVSAVGDAWEITRIIPAAALTGEAAGTAAAMAINENTTPDKLPMELIQAKLRKAGNILSFVEARSKK